MRPHCKNEIFCETETQEKFARFNVEGYFGIRDRVFEAKGCSLFKTGRC